MKAYYRSERDGLPTCENPTRAREQFRRWLEWRKPDANERGFMKDALKGHEHPYFVALAEELECYTIENR